MMTCRSDISALLELSNFKWDSNSLYNMYILINSFLPYQEHCIIHRLSSKSAGAGEP